jgi:hypothetical protein
MDTGGPFPGGKAAGAWSIYPLPHRSSWRSEAQEQLYLLFKIHIHILVCDMPRSPHIREGIYIAMLEDIYFHNAARMWVPKIRYDPSLIWSFTALGSIVCGHRQHISSAQASLDENVVAAGHFVIGLARTEHYRQLKPVSLLHSLQLRMFMILF